jgi:hypothetical protein
VRTLLNLFRSENCSHQFSWPRVLGDGRHYQTCLVCGAEFEYDWQRMQRGARILQEDSALSRAAASIRRKWKPRARRLKRDLPLRYRVMGRTPWQAGRVQDVSQSGIFFRAHSPLRVNQRLEMVFEMPSEILGAEGQQVIAVGCIVRSTTRTEAPMSDSETSKETPAGNTLGLSDAAGEVMLAANIWDYTLMSDAGESETEPAAAPIPHHVSRDPYC